MAVQGFICTDRACMVLVYDPFPRRLVFYGKQS